MLWRHLIRDSIRRHQAGEPVEVGWKVIVVVLLGWFLIGAAAGAVAATAIAIYSEQETSNERNDVHKPNPVKKFFRRPSNGS